MRRFLILALWLHTAFSLVAQERTYTHTDAADYAPGDRIWLKVYVVRANSYEPVADNLYAYVELTDEEGTLVNRAKLLCRDGVYAGYLDIPASTLAGRYLIRSYTKPSLITTEGGVAPIRCPLIIEADKSVYAPGDSVVLKLSVPDLKEAEMADISVSVTRLAPALRHQATSIITSFSSSAHSQPLTPTTQFCPADTTQTIAGHVVTLIRRRPEADAPVSLIAPKAGFFATTSTDADGRFCFRGLDFPEDTQYVLRATKHNGQDKVELIIDEEQRPDFDDIHTSGVSKIFVGAVADTLSDYVTDGILLDDVEVTGAYRNSASRGNVYAQMADFSFGLKKIEEIGATCLHELFRHIPGVKIHNNRCYIRANTSIYGDMPAAIAIDGVIVAEEYDLDNIQMMDVARVDLFKTGTTVIWGATGGSGVISITTKVGTYGETAKPSLNQKQVTPLGYQRMSSFFNQPSQRKTLYWNPHVTSDKILLNAGETPGTCHVVVEGVTTGGRLIHEETDFIVSEQ